MLLNLNKYKFHDYIITAIIMTSRGFYRHDRVKFFWEKSSAGIEWPEFGASFEQDNSAGELAAGQAGGRMLVLEGAPIVISAEGFRNLLFGVFIVYLKLYISSPFLRAL